MDARELLISCRNLMKEIGAIEEQIRRAGSIGGPKELTGAKLSGLPPGTNRPDAARNQLIERYEQMLEEKRLEAMDALNRFEHLLCGVQDATDRAILRYYYGAGWTDIRIAGEMELSDRTIRERRKRLANEL